MFYRGIVCAVIILMQSSPKVAALASTGHETIARQTTECNAEENLADFNLTYKDEIRFGPPYYTLTINGREIEGRIFGRNYFLTKDERFLITQEWLTVDYSEGPITRATIFDLCNLGFASTKRVPQGWVHDFTLEKGVIGWKTETIDSEGESTFETSSLPLSKIDEWRPIFPE